MPTANVGVAVPPLPFNALPNVFVPLIVNEPPPLIVTFDVLMI